MTTTTAEATAMPQFSKPLKAFAQLISIIVHPLFIPAIITFVLLYTHPVNSIVVEPGLRLRMMAMVFINTILFPALLVFLLYKLGFAKSIQMETQRERFIPLAASLLFFFWAYYVTRNTEGLPVSFRQWMLGVFLCGCAAEFTNIFKKISLHLIGLGGLVAFSAWQQATDMSWPGYMLPLSILLAGLVGTARLIKGAHEPSEIYAGFFAGVICQLAAAFMV